MPDEQLNQKQWPDQGQGQGQSPPLGTGEGEVPLAKPPEAPSGDQVDMRTSASDIQSTQEGGGGAPKPYTPPPAAPSEVPKEPQGAGVAGEPVGGQVFQPPQVEPSPTPAEFPESPGEVQVGAKKSKKGLFLGLLAVIIVVGLAAVGYFFIYPFFFQAPEEDTQAPSEVVTPPVEVPTAPEVPFVPEVPEVPEGEQAIEEPETPVGLPELPVITEHVSLFKTAADLTAELSFSTLDLGAFRGAFEFVTAEVPVLKETVLKDLDGEFISFGELMGVLLPNVFTSNVVQSFEPDFTVFVYTDNKGTWLGYVAKLKGGAVLSDAKNSVSKLEGDANINNLFLVDPGSSGAWNDGQAEGISNRFSTFNQAGAGLNYGWLNDVLVISTSYPGFQEALKRLK